MTMTRVLSTIAIVLTAGCLHSDFAPRRRIIDHDAYSIPTGAVPITPAELSAIRSLLPPLEPHHTRTMARIDKRQAVALSDVELKTGDIAVTDELESGGSTTRIFRKSDGKWNEVAKWLTIY